jgi:hypothetical protein
LYSFGKPDFSDDKSYEVTQLDSHISLQFNNLTGGIYELWIYLEPVDIEILRQPHEPIMLEYDVEIRHGKTITEKKYSHLLEKAQIGMSRRLFTVPKDFLWSAKGVEVIIKNMRFNDTFPPYYKTMKFYLKRYGFIAAMFY